MKKSVLYSIILFVSMVSSCRKEDPEPDCGCEGSTIKKIENARAVYYGSGLFSVVYESGDRYSYASMFACKIDSTWQKSSDPKVADYTISGNMKSVCFTGPTLIAQPSPLEITSIRKD
ncbi:hypothetical protein [Dyadobacter sp. CY312]|uniref:hypothetical protein n=1 Tax=Dyadobacter sp. CY312 TaxID=2907303 RepID=UPI001F2F86E0|nr:hypothetical protein [Dyadobacter sp. CY312]MCE7042424.1 hypothetical protein [Dyadobacter sp. CY312]